MSLGGHSTKNERIWKAINQLTSKVNEMQADIDAYKAEEARTLSLVSEIEAKLKGEADQSEQLASITAERDAFKAALADSQAALKAANDTLDAILHPAPVAAPEPVTAPADPATQPAAAPLH